MAAEFTNYKCPLCGGRIKKMPSKYGSGFYYFCEDTLDCTFKTTSKKTIEQLDSFSSKKTRFLMKLPSHS